MASKYFKAFNFFKKKGTVAPTITQPRQLPGTMKKIRSQYEKFGFKKAKTATDRANIVRNKKSIERMDKLDKAKAKRKEGIKGSKEVKKMGGGMMKRTMLKDGSLKPVDKKKNPGLSKLPTPVRNKMGFLKKGGRVK